MEETFKAVKVSEHVYWVGAIDWGIRNFHGYETRRGSTYNAYIIMDDKVTLIDTVKKPFVDEMLARISSVIDPEKIDYIISNHSEMDHSGGLPETIEAVKPEKVFASTLGVKTIHDHFHLDRELTPVREGEKVSLGSMDVTFLETRMLHWPESMFTYLEEDKLLFSQDAFGMHLATNERFADEVDESVLEVEGARYYANILLPMSPLILKLIEKVGKLPLKIEIIAPDHGPIWRKDPGKIIMLYEKWAKQIPARKAVVTFDTMWKSTELMGRVIADGITSCGVDVKLMPLQSSHRSDVITEVLDAAAFVVGSPTINNNMFPTVADLMYYIRGLKPQNKIGAVFGSFGWSGEAAGQLKNLLEEMKVELTGEPLKVKFVPDEAAFEQCRKMGIDIGNKINETVGK